MFSTSSQKLNAVIFGLFFVLFLRAIEDPDIWFHMTIGRAVLDLWTVPVEEFYVFTRLGDASEFHEWGFGVIYQLVYELAGTTGIIIFNALIGAATVLMLFLTTRLRNTSIAAALTAIAIGFWLMEFRFVQRPENFLYLAIAATIYILARYLQQSDWRYLIALPFIGLLLSQIHPSVIMLGLVIGTYLVEALFRRNRNMTQVYQLAFVIIASLLVSLINPYGLEQLILPIKFSLQSGFLQSFTEFLPSLSTAYAYRFIIALLIVIFSVSGLRKRFSLAEWLMLIAFSYLAYQHVRDIALLGLALVLPLATAIEATINQGKYKNILAAIILVLVAVDAERAHRLTLDIDPMMAPVSGAETIAQYSLSPNILNFYHLGNYLAWRLGDTHKVIIDGRNFQDNKSLKLHDSLLSAKPGWENTLNQYDIDSIVTPATLPYSGNFIPLAFELVRNSRWVMLSRETAGVTFIRRDRVPADIKGLPERDLWLQAKTELSTNLDWYPESESSLKNMKRVENYLAQD